jgi:hypothetical protein
MWHSRTSGQALKPDDGEEGDRPAQRLRVRVGVVAADHPGFLQPADAAQAGRRRDAGAARQLDIGHAAVGLQFGQDSAVDGVQDGRLGRLGLHVCDRGV